MVIKIKLDVIQFQIVLEYVFFQMRVDLNFYIIFIM